jgi:hypothetical protein
MLPLTLERLQKSGCGSLLLYFEKILIRQFSEFVYVRGEAESRVSYTYAWRCGRSENEIGGKRFYFPPTEFWYG